MKNDVNAKKFVEWYIMRFKREHENIHPIFIQKICEFQNKFEKLSEIKVMIKASDRYENNICQQIKMNLSNGKLRSKEELNIEIKRQLPIFLEVINYKRRKKNEPKVEENQVSVSTFLDIDSQGDVKIAYASESYILVMRRLIEESRKKIKEFINYN